MPHELDGTVEAQGTVSKVWVEMELCRDVLLAQLTVDERGTVGCIGVEATMVKADWAGLGIEMEDAVQSNVSAISLS